MKAVVHRLCRQVAVALVTAAGALGGSTVGTLAAEAASSSLGAVEPKLLGLFGGLPAAAPPPSGHVEVTGWVERAADGHELVVTLRPKGVAKLVADPGITVRPVESATGPSSADAVSLVDASRDYFEQPPTLRLKLDAAATGDAVLDVEYAYCLVDRQCLFGAETLRIPVPPSG